MPVLPHVRTIIETNVRHKDVMEQVMYFLCNMSNAKENKVWQCVWHSWSRLRC
jgi:hypothetical protein